MEALKFSELKFMKTELKIHNLPIEKIRPNPYQPRKYFNRGALEELAASISEYGVIQPVTVRKMGGAFFELVAGERRLRASELAGLTTIPAIILNVSDNDSAFLAFIENLQRQNLNFIEEAEGYKNLMEDYDLTQEELAARLSKSQSTIANKLRLLKLSETARRLILENNLTERHARAVLKIPDEEGRIAIIERIIREDLTVKRTEELVAETMEKMMEKQTEKLEQREKRFITDIRLFTNSIRQSVEIIRKSGMEVFYENKQEGDGCEILIKIKNTQE